MVLKMQEHFLVFAEPYHIMYKKTERKNVALKFSIIAKRTNNYEIKAFNTWS